MMLEKLDRRIETCRRMKLDYYLTSYTKINSKWIKDLNVRLETIKLLDENIGGNKLLDMDLDDDFLDLTPKTKPTKVKTNKWDYSKLKSFWTSRKPPTK